MNTILQKRIEEAKQKEYPLPPIVDGSVCKVLAMAEQTAYKKGAIFALQNQWISVEEALPPHKPIGQNQRFSLPVLLIKNNDVTTAYIDSFDFEQPSENVTHWAPIPTLEGGEKLTTTNVNSATSQCVLTNGENVKFSDASMNLIKASGLQKLRNAQRKEVRNEELQQKTPYRHTGGSFL